MKKYILSLFCLLTMVSGVSALQLFEGEAANNKARAYAYEHIKIYYEIREGTLGVHEEQYVYGDVVTSKPIYSYIDSYFEPGYDFLCDEQPSQEGYFVGSVTKCPILYYAKDGTFLYRYDFE